MSLNADIQYLNSLGLHTIKPGLQRVRKLLDYYGNPHTNIDSILIAGTNGKGSVTSIISSILSNNDYKVGKYTSPHLIDINERISINADNISTNDLSKIISELRIACKKIDIIPSYFEMITLVAFIYFYEQKVDISVYEVGMGGRWDATNVVKPLVSVITNVSFDHSEYLGNSLDKIAEEKSQIIKNKVPLVTSINEEAIIPVLRRASLCNSSTYRNGIDYHIETRNNYLSFFGMNSNLKRFKTNLRGIFQIQNLSNSLAVIDILKNHYNYKIFKKHTRNALLNICWPCRFEIINKKNKIILDSAHNEGSAKALVLSLKKMFPNTKFNFLIGMLTDKNHLEFLTIVSTISNQITLTDNFSEREISVENLAKCCTKAKIKYNIIRNYHIAYSKMIQNNCPLCICGSIYLAGAIKKIIKNTYSPN